VSIVLETNWRENKWYQLLGFYVLLGLIQPDQPNRAVRTRMLRGVGGALSDGRPYPYMGSFHLSHSSSTITQKTYALVIEEY
jgi:hypothetical protein